MSQVYDSDDYMPRAPTIHWSAIFAGALAALITHVLLNLLGLGIGAWALDPGPTPQPDAAGGAAFAWWSVSGVLSALVGGLVAGRVLGASGPNERPMPVSHGLLAWTVSSLVVIASITGMMGGGAAAIGGPLAARIADSATMQQGQAVTPAATPEAPQAEAEQAADAVASGALFSVLALAIGAIASAFGARMAFRRWERGAAERSRARMPDTRIYSDGGGRRTDRDIRPH